MMESVGVFIRWYLVVQLLGILAWPWSHSLFTRLPDRGYSFSKMIGILGLGLASWWLVSYKLATQSRFFLYILALVCLAIVALGYHSKWPKNLVPLSFEWLRENKVLVITVELVFLASFLFWVAFRSTDPSIVHTEQPMDLMLISGLWASTGFPPQDPWLSGFPVGYYYFGYWLLVTLGHLAITLPEVTYNIGQALWFGLLTLGCFGLGYNLGTSKPRPGLASRPGVLTGLLSAVWVGLCGNLQGVLEWLYAKGLLAAEVAGWWAVKGFPEEAHVTGEWTIGSDWWWWRSSRIVQDLGPHGERIEVITEFPYFSFFLGDNHPHLLSLPFLILFLGFLLNFVLASDGRGDRHLYTDSAEWSWNRLRFSSRELLLLPAVICLGAVTLINAWNLLGCLLLVLAVYLIDCLKRGEKALSVLFLPVLAALILAAGTILFWPFLILVQGSVSGILLNCYNPTQVRQLLIIFGSFIPATLALFLLHRLRGTEGLRLAGIVFGLASVTPIALVLLTGTIQLSGALSSIAFARWASAPWAALLLGIFVSVSLAVVLQKSRGFRRDQPTGNDRSSLFSLLLIGVGWLLVLIPEFVFFRDMFGTRMNTVFKLYYLAWPLLGIGASYAVVHCLRSSNTGPRVLSILSLCLMLAGLVYPATTLGGRLTSFRGSPSLNGLGYLKETAPDEWAAIEWIRRNTAPGDIILESIGESYRADTSRFSATTGRPTLLGWPGHEIQWRGNAYGDMAAGRAEAVELIYEKGTLEEIVKQIDKWGLNYVVVGPVERARHSIDFERDQLLGKALEEVFRSGPVTIYRKREW